MSLRLLTIFLLQTCVMLSAVAQSGTDVAGAADHPNIARFPGSQIIEYRTVADSNYRLALGRMQRVNGRVTAGREERVQGLLTRITYQIPSGYPGAEVFTHFAGQLLADGGAELFRCQGRACGSSNFWANDVFGNRILYGPEPDQFYLAVTLGDAREGVKAYAVVYVITRGNRSVHAHVDVLEPASDAVQTPIVTAQNLLTRLHDEGSAILPAITFDEQDRLIESAGITLLAEALGSEPQMRVYVVAHLSAIGELASLLERSQWRAAAVVSELVAAGIAQERIIAQGVGPLAPACRPGPCAERIEVVVQQ